MVRKVLAVQKVMRTIFNFRTARTKRDLDSLENYDEIYAHVDDWGLIGDELEILNLFGQNMVFIGLNWTNKGQWPTVKYCNRLWVSYVSI